MATGSPAKPWERNRGTTSTSSLRNESILDNTNSIQPSLPSRTGLMGNSNFNGSSPYSSYGSSYGNSYSSPYGSSYGSSYGGGYDSMSRYGGNMYGNRMGSSLYSSPYGSSYGGSSYGNRYGSMYGSSGAYGNRYGSMYGGSGAYGSTYSRYGSGYDDASFRNPYPRGKYWSYGGEEDEFGNPIGDAVDGGTSLLMDMENVVEGFGHFTRILDYNFDAIHGSFASVIRLFDSMGELRRAIYYGIQGLAIFSLFKTLFKYLQKFIYKLLGKPIPPSLTTPSTKQIKNSVESFEDQWNGNSGNMMNQRRRNPNQKKSSKALLLLLGFFALILGGPVIFSAIYKSLRPRSKNNINRRISRPKPQAQAQYDFNGEAEGDLPFKKGDIITIRRQIGNGWLEGELANGQVGIVPETYIKPYRPNINNNTNTNQAPNINTNDSNK